jgi:transcriptional regulator with XRE-family HTH domain
MQATKTTQPFGELIKRKRIERNLTLEAIAKLAGIATSALWYIEHGRQPNDRTRYRLCQILGLDFDSAA